MKNKAVRVLFLFLTGAFLVSCGDPVLTEDSTPEVIAVEIETEASGEEAEGMQEGERQEGESREEIPAAASAEVSDREVTVSYAGEAFIKSLFAAGGEMLWLYGVKDDGNFFLGYMGQEGDVFQETEVSPGADMRAFNMVVDRQGRCHILWMGVQKETVEGREFDRLTFDRSCITIVDSSGKMEKEIQVSDVFSEEQGRPFCFVVDEAGNYYFEDGMQLVQILPDGTQGGTFSCAGPICGIGIGKSGSIYCSSEREGGATVWKNWRRENFACAAPNCLGQTPAMQEFTRGRIQSCCFSIKTAVFLPFRTAATAGKLGYRGRRCRCQGKKSEAMAFWQTAGHAF